MAERALHSVLSAECRPRLLMSWPLGRGLLGLPDGSCRQPTGVCALQPPRSAWSLPCAGAPASEPPGTYALAAPRAAFPRHVLTSSGTVGNAAAEFPSVGLSCQHARPPPSPQARLGSETAPAHHLRMPESLGAYRSNRNKYKKHTVVASDGY